MSKTRCCRAANVLIGVTAVVLVAAGIVGALDWDGAVSGRAYAVGLIGIGVGVVALAVNARQATGQGVQVLEHAVAQAPRDQYYQGYGDGAADALDPPDQTDDGPV